MKLITGTVLAVLIFCAGGLIMSQAAEDPAKGKGAASMDLDGGRKGRVPFPHHVHQASLNSCAPCHDVFAREPGAIVKSKAAGKLAAKQVMTKICINCHKEKINAGLKSGPTSCGQCHIK